MKKSSISVIISIMIISLFGPALSADEISTPSLITTFKADRGTMGIPRWKGYMDQANPDHLWVSYANAGSTLGNVNYTTDGGQTWSTNIMQVDFYGYLDFHTSLFGRNGELYFTWPGRDYVCFRKFNAPAQSADDRDPIHEFSYTTGMFRSNIMVQDNGRIWVFTRSSDDAAENVKYNYSDDGGQTWTNGVAFATNFASIRIGSMPYVNGNPALVVLYLNDGRGYEYYLWNGTQFERKADASIYAGNVQMDRAFTHNVIDGQYLHLVFSFNNDLFHCWKAYNNGSGSWNRQVIVSSPNTDGMEWYPISTVRGNDMYVFYCRKATADETSSEVFYRKWSQDTESWTEPILVSTGLSGQRNLQPNTCPTVPVSSDYIPVYWQSGPGPDYNINFNKITVSSTPVIDTIPPGAIFDLHTD